MLAEGVELSKNMEHGAITEKGRVFLSSFL